MKYILSTLAFSLFLSLNSNAQTADSSKSVTIRLDIPPKQEVPQNQPLYVLKGAPEGVKLTQAQLKTIDPGWIDKVEVLKGEKATDKYGNAGSNGVIILILKEEKLQQVIKSLEM